MSEYAGREQEIEARAEAATDLDAIKARLVASSGEHPAVFTAAEVAELVVKLAAVKAHLVAQSSARFQDAKASYEVIDCILKGGD